MEPQEDHILSLMSVIVELQIRVGLFILMQFNLRNFLSNYGIFLPVHPVYIQGVCLYTEGWYFIWQVELVTSRRLVYRVHRSQLTVSLAHTRLNRATLPSQYVFSVACLFVVHVVSTIPAETLVLSCICPTPCVLRRKFIRKNLLIRWMLSSMSFSIDSKRTCRRRLITEEKPDEICAMLEIYLRKLFVWLAPHFPTL